MATLSLNCCDERGHITPLCSWISNWSHAYKPDDEAVYRTLIEKHASLTSHDFETIGKWKDGALKGGSVSIGKWKPNVASVAYEVWMSIASERPTCPTEDGIQTFLVNWSDKRYQDRYVNGTIRVKRFGLSRASTLLHFISGARYPIFDSRVRSAISALTGNTVDYSVHAYQGTVRPLVSAIMAECQILDLRSIDRALFAYGAWVSRRQKKKAKSAASE